MKAEEPDLLLQKQGFSDGDEEGLVWSPEYDFPDFREQVKNWMEALGMHKTIHFTKTTLIIR